MSDAVKHSQVVLTDDLAQEVQTLRRLDPRYRGYRAWQSRPSKIVPEWLNPVFQQVCENVGTEYYHQEWWANIADQGKITRWHNHPRFDRVAVAYVTVPGGAIEFRQGEGYWTEQPQAGDLLIFPGTLEHQVQANTSTESRISIAFNFTR